MTLAEKVKSLREAQGMTQEELADALRYPTAAMVKKVENGRPVSVSVVERFAAALGTTPEYLLENTGIPYRSAAYSRQKLHELVDNMTDAQVNALLLFAEELNDR